MGKDDERLASYGGLGAPSHIGRWPAIARPASEVPQMTQMGTQAHLSRPWRTPEYHGLREWMIFAGAALCVGGYGSMLVARCLSKHTSTINTVRCLER
jgi:hypothetical protein